MPIESNTGSNDRDDDRGEPEEFPEEHIEGRESDGLVAPGGESRADSPDNPETIVVDDEVIGEETREVSVDLGAVRTIGQTVTTATRTDGGIVVDVQLNLATETPGDLEGSRGNFRFNLDKHGRIIEPPRQSPGPAFADMQQRFGPDCQEMPPADQERAKDLFTQAHAILRGALPEYPAAKALGVEQAVADTDGIKVVTRWIPKATYGREDLVIVNTDTDTCSSYGIGPDGVLRRNDYIPATSLQAMRDFIAVSARRKEVAHLGPGARQRREYELEAEEAQICDRAVAAIMGNNYLPVGSQEMATLIAKIGEAFGVSERLRPLLDSFNAARHSVTPDREGAPLEGPLSTAPDLSTKVCQNPRVQSLVLERLKQIAFEKWPDHIKVRQDDAHPDMRYMILECPAEDGRMLTIGLHEDPYLKDSAGLRMFGDTPQDDRNYYSGDHTADKGMRVLETREEGRARYRIPPEQAADILNKLQRARPRGQRPTS